MKLKIFIFGLIFSFIVNASVIDAVTSASIKYSKETEEYLSVSRVSDVKKKILIASYSNIDKTDKVALFLQKYFNADLQVLKMGSMPGKKVLDYDFVILGTHNWEGNIPLAVKIFVNMNFKDFKNKDYAVFSISEKNPPIILMANVEKAVGNKSLASTGFFLKDFSEKNVLSEKLEKFIKEIENVLSKESK